jgi:TRAP-type transport system periplasmic protein
MRRLALVALAALLMPAFAQAQTVTIKLGTMAPDGSAWHNLLKGMGEKWSALSGGKVKLKIYAGGVAGNEGDMVRKLRVGQLNAAALSVVGLHDIETSAQCLAAPCLVESQAEQDWVVEKMAPAINARFLEKGFQVLTWGDTGTVHIYLNKDVKTLADIKGVKMFAWAGDPFAVKSLELAGFQPVVISSTDIPSSLQTGMIQAFATADIMAFTARWFENAKSMVVPTWGHLPGATIVNKDAWEKIPADLRPQLLAAAMEVGVKVNAEVVKMNADALEQMKKAGLKMVDLPPAEMPAWYQMGEKMWPAVRGGVCTAQHFDEIIKVRDDFRKAKGKK